MIYKATLTAAAAVLALGSASQVQASAFIAIDLGTSQFNGSEWINTGANFQSHVVTPDSAPSNSAALTSQGGSASGYANLATGKMGVLAASDHWGRSSGRVWLNEELNFQIDGAHNDTVTAIGVTFTLHTNTPDQHVYFGGSLGGASFLDLGTFGRPYYSYGTGFSSFTRSVDGDTITYDGVYNLTGSSASLLFQMDLRTQTEGPAVADFSQTAGIRFQLPRAATFTSASGQFLSAVGAVPEPATWAMMIIGMGAIGGSMRRRAAMTGSYKESLILA